MNGEVTITVGNGTVRLGTTTRDGEAVLVLDKGQTLLDVACFLDAMGWRTVDVNSDDDLPPAPSHWAEVELRKCKRVLDEHLTIKGGSVSERLRSLVMATTVGPAPGTWPWACEQMIAGRKVRRPKWCDGYRWGVVDGWFYGESDDGRAYTPTLHGRDMRATDWTLYGGE